MITKTVNLFSFDELSKEAKQHALSEHYDINVQDYWYDFTYQDAATIELKITGFDLEQRNQIEGEFNWLNDTAAAILQTFADTEPIFSTAAHYLVTEKLLEDSAAENSGDESEERAHQFSTAVLAYYWERLKSEWEYLTSEAAIIETFEANGYTFDEYGKMENL